MTPLAVCRTLLQRDQAGDADRSVVAVGGEVARSRATSCLQQMADQRERMRTQAQPGRGVVGGDRFARRRWPQQHAFFRRDDAFEQRQLRLDAGDLPARAMAVAGQSVQRIRFGEATQRMPIPQTHNHPGPDTYLKAIGEGDSSNVLGNIVMLTSASKKLISDNPPSKYVPPLRESLGGNCDSVFASNLLPAPSVFDYERATYAEFLAERGKLITAYVTQLVLG